MTDGSSQPQKKHRDAFEWTTLVTAIIGVVLLFLYTGITGYQAYIARDTERHQLQAYLGVTGSLSPPDKSGSAYVTILVHNYGQTPAIRTDVLSGGFVGPTALREEQLPFARYKAVRNSNELIIFPTQEYPATISPPFLKDELQKLTSVENAAFAHGTILYEDIFGVHHETKFCFYWLKGNILSGSHGFCLYGNEAK
jgi:hypothetical protein